MSANVRISNLPNTTAAAIVDTDIVPIVIGIASGVGVTSKVTVAELRLKLGTTTPAGGRTVTSAATYLSNNAVFNVKDFGAVGDGAIDDTVAVKLTITSMPASGGTLYFPPGAYKLTTGLSTEINGKRYIRFLGAQGRTWRGTTASGPAQSSIYIKSLTEYLYTKSGTTTEALEFENITIDGRNGASPAATCPGVVYSNGINLLHFGFRKSVATGFDYAHTNVAGQRALFDLQAVWAEIDESEISFAQNGRLLKIEASTQTMIRRTEFTVARECFYVRTSDNIVFDTCVFESATFVGASYLSQTKLHDCWFENIGFNASTAFTTGIAERNHGLVFGAGALVAAGGIIYPISQLYGSLHIDGARIQTLATGGSNYTAPAWIESLGQATATSTGASLYVSGKKKGVAGQLLFASTMAFAATERGTAVNITVEDSWSTENGGVPGGGSLFVGDVTDARKINRGFGRITMNDATVYIFEFHGGRLWSNVEGTTDAISLPPSVPGIAATKYPAGGQWEVGDRLFFNPQTSAYTFAVECTTAGTVAPVWGLINEIAAPGGNKGDANVTLASFAEATIVMFNTALTANRTVTLPTPATSFPRQKWRIVRNGLGAFTLTVQTSAAVALKVMPAATAAFVEVSFSASANEWVLTGYGTL